MSRHFHFMRTYTLAEWLENATFEHRNICAEGMMLTDTCWFPTSSSSPLALIDIDHRRYTDFGQDAIVQLVQ
jgi:hypothetical protein